MVQVMDVECGVRDVMMCFFFKQKTAYEMRISDWSSDVCSSDLSRVAPRCAAPGERSEVRGCNGGPCSIPSKGESGLAARLGKAGAIACRVTVAAHGGPLQMPGTVIGKPTILDPDDERPCLILGARSVKIDRKSQRLNSSHQC